MSTPVHQQFIKHADLIIMQSFYGNCFSHKWWKHYELFCHLDMSTEIIIILWAFSENHFMAVARKRTQNYCRIFHIKLFMENCKYFYFIFLVFMWMFYSLVVSCHNYIKLCIFYIIFMDLLDIQYIIIYIMGNKNEISVLYIIKPKFF